jgi:hypothetical protein
MADVGKEWLSDVMRSDELFLKELGVEDCVIIDPYPEPPPLPEPDESFVDLTEYDQVLLQALAVAWVQRFDQGG